MTWRDNWVCFSPAMDSIETDILVDLFLQEGIKQNWWTTYGSIRGILWAMGLDSGKPHVFHGSKYVGSNLDEVKTYIYTMKRIHGEL